MIHNNYQLPSTWSSSDKETLASPIAFACILDLHGIVFCSLGYMIASYTVCTKFEVFQFSS